MAWIVAWFAALRAGLEGNAEQVHHAACSYASPMKQQTLAMAADQGDGFERYRRATKRDVFLSAMDEIVPWDALCELIEPHHPSRATGARPWTAAHAAHVLRAALVQPGRRGVRKKRCWTAPRRRFVGIDLGRERVPDNTTLLKFRLASGTTAWASSCSPPLARFCRPGAEAGHRHHRGRHHHRRTQLDEERRQGPRSRDAPDAQGSAVVLRHEAAHRVDSRAGAGAQRRGHRSQRARQAPAARSAARRRAASMATAPTPARSRLSSPRRHGQDFTNQRSRRGGHIDEAVRAKNRTKSQVRAASSTCSAWSSGCGVPQGALPRPG